MNWRRGFNRVFIVLAIGWAGYVLFIHPLIDRQKAWHDYRATLKTCSETEVPSRVIDPDYSRCAKGAEVFLNFRLEQDSPHVLLNWRAALELLAILIFPPSAAYGLFRLGWFVLTWLLGGFDQPAS